MAAALKTAEVKASGGSNPSLSAIFYGELAEFGLMQHIANVSMSKASKGSNPLLSAILCNHSSVGYEQLPSKQWGGGSSPSGCTTFTECSSVWVERCVRGAKVVCSNHTTPTIFNKGNFV